LNLKITNTVENNIFSRNEITATLDYSASTPSRKDILKELSKQLKVNEDMIIVDNVKTKFKERTAIVVARAYKDKKILEEVEGEYFQKRGIAKEKTPKEAAPEKKDEPKKDAPKKDAELKGTPKAGDDKAKTPSGNEGEGTSKKPEAKSEEKKEITPKVTKEAVKAEEEKGKKSVKKGEKPAKKE